jgi:hypothetical protein
MFKKRKLKPIPPTLKNKKRYVLSIFRTNFDLEKIKKTMGMYYFIANTRVIRRKEKALILRVDANFTDLLISSIILNYQARNKISGSLKKLLPFFEKVI